MTREDTARHEKTRQGTRRHGKAREDTTRHEKAREGTGRHEKARGTRARNVSYSQRCDIYVHLHMIYKYMSRWRFLIEFADGFTLFFIRGNKERSEGDRSINNWGYFNSFKPKTLLLTLGDHGDPWEGPEKSRKFLFQNPNIDHKNWSKVRVAQSFL